MEAPSEDEYIDPIDILSPIEYWAYSEDRHSFSFESLHQYYFYESPRPAPEEVRRQVLELTAQLMHEGLFTPVDIVVDVEATARNKSLGRDWPVMREVPRPESLDEILAKLAADYPTHYDDRQWLDNACWLLITDKGRELAAAAEAKVDAANAAYTEKRRAYDLHIITGARSLDTVLKDQLPDLTAIPPQDCPDWLTAAPLPTDWQTVDLDPTIPNRPTRTAVLGPHNDGGWYGTETIHLFTFTGPVPTQAIHDNIGCTLHDLAKTDEKVFSHKVRVIETTTPTPDCPIAGARATGGYYIYPRPYRAQYNAYAAGSDRPGHSLLLLHAIHGLWGIHDYISDDTINQLTDTVYTAFCRRSSASRSR